MKKYIITFLITSSIFLSAFFISDRVNVSRVEQLKNVQEKVSLSILSTETRFALLKESSCEDVFDGEQLEIGITDDLNQLVTRIKFLESELGSDNEDVLLLKKRYTLLQAKDFLLVRELARKCDYTVATVVYFHTADCADCRKQSIVLDKVREENNHVRVYWMDASIHEPTTETLARLYGVKEYPTLVLGEDVHSGFTEYDVFAENLLQWAQEHNAVVNVLPKQELVDRGRDYILSLDEYESFEEKEILFKDNVAGVYHYQILVARVEENGPDEKEGNVPVEGVKNENTIKEDQQMETISLRLDPIVNTFSIITFSERK